MSSSNEFVEERTDNPVGDIICVDLDGTLSRTDTLIELFLVLLRKRAWAALVVPIWLLRGRAYMKWRLADTVELSPGSLSYNCELLDYLTDRKRDGCRLVLATASSESVAENIATHIGIFDGVVASSKTQNLRGQVKANKLVELFGEGGYRYAGNDRHDVPVWKHASSAIVVSNSSRLLRKIGAKIEKVIEPTNVTLLLSILRAMRIRQWVKNLLVFVPLLASGTLGNTESLLRAIIAFVSFSLLASAVYLVNDLFDLHVDRRHPTKKLRPFAAGTLPLAWGVSLAPFLVVSAFIGSFSIGFDLALVLFFYLLLTTLYTMWLKTQPLVDIFTLSALYGVRIVAGGVATGISLSLWLLSFSSFLFLSLALVKRYPELKRAAERSDHGIARRGYHAAEYELLATMGIASTFASAIVLALYLDSAAVQGIYPNYGMMWGMVPLLLFWQCRLWLAAIRGKLIDDPIEYSASDWVSWVVVAGLGICYVGAILG